jgi:cold shock CspA family protein
MAKSQITASKKDREKRKQMERREKLQRKEDRKTNNNKGKGLDAMLAYVDEYGRITDTPPDPTRKSRVKASDMEIGVPRQGPVDPADAIRRGTVTFFNESKGYGFIRDTDSRESIFVHANSLANPIKENDKVTFEIERGPKGLNAVKVKSAG